jgi:hypothetical protein
MIFTNKNEQSIYIQCDCGCSGIHLDKFEWDGEPKEYILSLTVNAYYEQQGRFNNFKRKIKMLWYILRHGTHRFADIYLTVEDFKELKELIKNYK